jgi:hypothetical protein
MSSGVWWLAFLDPRLWMLNARKVRLAKAFEGELVHEIVISPGPDGRPGQRLLAPTPLVYAPRRPHRVDGNRDDLTVLLSRRGSWLKAVCLGPVAERGAPPEVIRDIVRDFDRCGFPLTSEIEQDVIAGEPATRARFMLPFGALIERHVARDEWLYAIGVGVRRGDDEAAVADLARRVLETWRWTRAAG